MFQVEAAGLMLPVEEYRFHATRRWRFDYAVIEKLLAFECEGGVWTSGRHIRPTGFLKDMEKYNSAAMLGWRVFRFTPQMVKTGEALDLYEQAVND